MIIARIKYLTKIARAKIGTNLRFIQTINFDWKNVLISIASILIIVILLINIINVIKNGTERYSLIETEIEKLNTLKKRNEDLKKELAYKGSDDYLIKISLDELNLVYPNSKVYFIKGDNSFVPYVDVKKEVLRENIATKTKIEEWYELFFN